MSIELIKFFRENQDSLDMILDLIPVPVFTKDVEGRYITCNAAFEEFIGITRNKLIGNGVYDLWPRDQADVYYTKDKELFDAPGLQVYETNVTTTGGEEKIVQFHKTTFLDGNGKVAGLLGVIFDRTQEKQLEYKLKHFALVDELTGLPNRRSGSDTIKRLLSESQRKGRMFSIAMMDIDHFKKINDTYGHGAGDKVLKSIKNITAAVLRQYDFIFRCGGEEFMLCFPESDAKQARSVSERLRKEFENSRITINNNQVIKITVSLGVASYPEHGTNMEDLTKACDDALYLAKHSGRNLVKVAS